MMIDMSTSGAVERLPIVGTQSDKERILRVPKVENKSGLAVGTAVFDTLVKFKLDKIVEVVNTDTETSNVGKYNGAVAVLERKLGRSLLYLGCRHHVFEVVLKAVFLAKLSDSKTKSPNVEIFNRLKNNWDKMQTRLIKSGTEDIVVQNHIDSDFAEKIVQFGRDNLEKPQCRADYREFLELVVLFVGGQLPKGNKLKKPGAIHHARWMAKTIGALKIFLLRDQFEFENGEFEGIRKVCIFLIRLYVKAWFQAPSAIKAPRTDLEFIKDAIDYASIDEEISSLVVTKMTGHLWYLSQEAVGMAFFDDEIPINEKRRMLYALNKEQQIQKRLTATVPVIKSTFKFKQMSDFVSFNTRTLFERFRAPTDFLSLDPEEWGADESYKKAKNIFEHVHVVNDSAERAVKLFSEYNFILSKDEEEKQFIVNVVQEYRSKYPSFSKADLS